MPLDNTASIKDVIASLQTIEGINAKADLASVIGSPAMADDSMAALVSLIQQSKNELAMKMNDGSTGAEPLQTLVGNLVMGKKWASGKVNASDNMATISGLNFKPSYIMLTLEGSAVEFNFVIYNVDWSPTAYLLKGIGDLANRAISYNGGYIILGGFKLNTIAGINEWIAFE